MATVQTRCRNAYYVLTLLWVEGLKQSSQMSLRKSSSNLNSNSELFQTSSSLKMSSSSLFFWILALTSLLSLSVARIHKAYIDYVTNSLANSMWRQAYCKGFIGPIKTHQVWFFTQESLFSNRKWGGKQMCSVSGLILHS